MKTSTRVAVAGYKASRKEDVVFVNKEGVFNGFEVSKAAAVKKSINREREERARRKNMCKQDGGDSPPIAVYCPLPDLFAASYRRIRRDRLVCDRFFHA